MLVVLIQERAGAGGRKHNMDDGAECPSRAHGSELKVSCRLVRLRLPAPWRQSP
jgi:hypothetical protein